VRDGGIEVDDQFKLGWLLDCELGDGLTSARRTVPLGGGFLRDQE
jgi:hypothetical protein